MPALSKKRKAAREREYRKQRPRRLSAASKDDASEGSDYVPESDSEESNSEGWRNDSLDAGLFSEKDSESEGEESDGSDLLEMEELVVETDDWDPTLRPLSGICPLFTKPISFSGIIGPKRGVYTGNSTTTKWREQTRKNELAREAQRCRDIRSYFKPKSQSAEVPGEGGTYQPSFGVGTRARTDLPPFNSDELNCREMQLDEMSSSEEEDGVVVIEEIQDENLSSDTRDIVDSAFDLLVTCLKGLQVDVSHELGGLRVSVKAMRDGLVVNMEEAHERSTVEIEASSPEPPNTLGSTHSAEESVQPEMPPSRPLESRPETDFELMERSLRGILKQLKRSKSANVQDIADVAVISDYNVLYHQLRRDGHRKPKWEASMRIASAKLSGVSRTGNPIAKGEWYARQLRRKAEHVRKTGTLPERMQGKGATHASLFNEEDVQKAIKLFFGHMPIGEVTPHKLMKHMNEEVLPSLPHTKKTISEPTAKLWMRKHGYKLVTHRNRRYEDGHERPDVIEYRKRFLEILAAYEPLMRKYEGDNCEPSALDIPPGVREIVAAFHDESCFHANDRKKSIWLTDSQQQLRQKSRGRLVHVSDFIVEDRGRIHLHPAEIQVQMSLPESERLESFDARTIIYPGKNGDGYWDMKQLLVQVRKTLKICSVTHPDKQMLFIFDQSSAHRSFAANALNPKKMNVRPGGGQPVMHDTHIPMDNPNPDLRGVFQSMILPPDHPTHAGQPKGMEVVLKERGLWSRLEKEKASKNTRNKAPVGRCEACKTSAAKRDNIESEARSRMEAEPDLYGSIEDALLPGESLDQVDHTESENVYCCMEKCLANQADFLAEKPLLQQEIEAAGHLCLFLPKFHCELNPIEMYWGFAKHRFRDQCDGSFPRAKALVPKCLDACPTVTIRRFFRRSWRYVDAYRSGLTGKMADFAVKKYTSHRRIGQRIMMEVDMLVT